MSSIQLMQINLFVLMRSMPNSSWWPEACSDGMCPSPTFVVVTQNSLGLFSGALTEEEWIKEYKSRMGLQESNVRFKFVPLCALSF